MISIVTPAYNRGNLLIRCYDSLTRQTSFDFEWIVIDDGSTDNTRDILTGICKCENNFEVKYVYKENGGKHTALNKSHDYITGEYVIILDSDDYLTDDCIETVIKEWDKYNHMENLGLIAFEKITTDGNVTAYADDERVLVDGLRYKKTSVVSSDSAEVIRANIFKDIEIPVYENEKFIAETAIWYVASQKYKTMYINKPIYVCEYLEGGLSDGGRKLRTSNPLGGMYTSYLRMNTRCENSERLRAALLFIVYGKYAGLSNHEISCRAGEYSRLIRLVMLPGNLMYGMWKKRY